MPTYANPKAIIQDVNRRLVFVIIFACAGAFTLGFDNAWWGGVLGNPYFNRIFGELRVIDGKESYSLTATQQATGTAVGQAGVAIGCLAGGWFTDKFGRKNNFYWSAGIAIIGCLIQLTSGINGGRYWQLVAGKLIVCLSTGLSATGIPLYLAECAPASVRGAAVTMFNVMQTVGSFCAFLTMYLVANLLDKRVWCIPMGLQMIGPAAVIVAGPFLVESPRWLFEQGRIEETHEVLTYLRRGLRDYAVEEEVKQYDVALAAKLKAKQSNWVDLFKGVNLRRTGIAAGIQVFQQAQGIGFMGAYLVIFFFALGFDNS